MTKKQVDHLIANMKKGEVVTKVSPWMDEITLNKTLEVRYIGIKLEEEWSEIIPLQNNLLLKFTHTRGDSRVEFYIANKPPFFKFWSQRLTDNDKWETLLGELKRKLKREKQEFIHHKQKAGNLYQLINPYLK